MGRVVNSSESVRPRGFSLPVAPHGTWDDKERRIGAGLFRDVSVPDAGSSNAIVDLTVFWSAAVGYAAIRQAYSGSSGVTDFGYFTGTGGGLPGLGANDYMTFEGSYPLASVF